MAIYNDVVVTNAGIALLRGISLQNRALNAMEVVTSERLVSDPAGMTGIPNVVQRRPYSLFARGDNQFVLEAQLTNAGVAAAYTLNTIGFYAHNGAGGNALLAVITAKVPDVIPPASSYPVNVNFKAIITLDSGGNVTINASFAGFAAKEEFKALEARVDNGPALTAVCTDGSVHTFGLVERPCCGYGYSYGYNGMSGFVGNLEFDGDLPDVAVTEVFEGEPPDVAVTEVLEVDD